MLERVIEHHDIGPLLRDDGDGLVDSNVATVSIEVMSVNDAPAAQNDFAARMDWCVQSAFGGANHAPVARVDGTLVRGKRYGVFKDYTIPMLQSVFGTAGAVLIFIYWVITGTSLDAPAAARRVRTS